MTTKVKFSSINDPRTFDPDAISKNVITCVTPGDAQKAASILNAISSDNDRLRAFNAELVAALKEASGMIEREYCAHPDKHSADNTACWTAFIYAALAKAKEQK